MEITKAVRKYVLCIDGGGFRGLACLLMLDHLMEILNRGQDITLLPCDVFDLVCGTSTGGLIAILLGRLGLDCTTAMSVYKELGSDLFGGSSNEKMAKKTANANPNIFEEKLAAIVEKYTGDKDTLLKLSKANADRIVHKTADIFVTTVHSIATSGVTPHRLRSYSTPPRAVETIFHPKWTIFEATHAALASPLYLERFSIESCFFQDASNSGLANPVFEALYEAELRWGNKVEPVIISLGTGLTPLASIDPYLNYKPRRASGYFGKLLHNIFRRNDGDTKAWSAELAKQLDRVARDTELIHQDALGYFKERKLSRNYFRFNPTVGLGDIGISDIGQTASGKIMAFTYSWLGSNDGQDMVERASEALREPRAI